MASTMGSTKSGWSIVDYTKAIVACRKHPKKTWQQALELLGDLEINVGNLFFVAPLNVLSIFVNMGDLQYMTHRKVFVLKVQLHLPR